MLLAGLLGCGYVQFWRTPVYVVIGVAMWLAVLRSGVHPSVVGVALGLLVNAYAPRRRRHRPARSWPARASCRPDPGTRPRAQAAA